jgi:hypothetical protein
MRWEIGGSLLEIQGSIERALDIIERDGSICQRVERSASPEYQFTHPEMGDIGKIKLTVRPQNETELYGYEPLPPDDRWLVEFLPKHVALQTLSKPLQALLLTYTWQIGHNLFNLPATDLWKIAYAQETVDYGWDKYGLEDSELRKQALAELETWKKKVHERRLAEFNSILDVIESQLREDGFPITKPTRADSAKTPTRTTKPSAPGSRRNSQSKKTDGKPKFQQRSIRGMLDLTAYRESIRRAGRTMSWTHNPFGNDGRIDTATADRLVEYYGDELKAQWDDRKYDAKPFVEKMLKDYPELSEYWERKTKEYS